MARRHVSLLLSPSPVQRLAASLLGVKGPAGPAATEAFRDLQTTPADSHLQQPHPACVTALCIAMAAQIPAPFCLEGFSAGSYTGALLAVLLHRLWEPGLRSGELGVDETETDDPAPIRSTVALGALGMPDWVFSALLGTPYRVFLLHHDRDALCPWPLDLVTRERLCSSPSVQRGKFVWLRNAPAGFFGDKGHAYDHLLAELDALPEVVDVEADKGYMPLLDPATELTLAFQFLHVHRSTELRKGPHDEVLAALFPHPCTAESLQRVAHITALPRALRDSLLRATPHSFSGASHELRQWLLDQARLDSVDSNHPEGLSLPLPVQRALNARPLELVVDFLHFQLSSARVLPCSTQALQCGGSPSRACGRAIWRLDGYTAPPSCRLRFMQTPVSGPTCCNSPHPTTLVGSPTTHMDSLPPRRAASCASRSAMRGDYRGVHQVPSAQQQQKGQPRCQAPQKSQPEGCGLSGSDMACVLGSPSLTPNLSGTLVTAHTGSMCQARRRSGSLPQGPMLAPCEGAACYWIAGRPGPPAASGPSYTFWGRSPCSSSLLAGVP